jgi:uncharacterized protein (DUF1499 family)
MQPSEREPLPVSKAVPVAGWLALISALLLGGGPISYRLGLTHADTANDIFHAGGIAAVAALGAALVALFLILVRPRRSSGALNAAATALFSAAAIAALLHWSVIPAWKTPAIHDVVTSPRDPPEFVALRTVHYERHSYSRYQEKDPRSGKSISAAHPQIATLIFDRSLRQVFRGAQDTARALGWSIAATARTEGRLEAIDRATIFGFHDDIVIRVRLNTAGYTVLDIRSASREDHRDLGRNARRIEAFVAHLKSHLP